MNNIRYLNSYGIISFYIDKSIDISLNKINFYLLNKYLTITNFNYKNLSNIQFLSNYYDKIKILMIRRRHSLNYVQFIRGKYNINNKENINKLFQLMTLNENELIQNNSFDFLWNELWKNNAQNDDYKKEYLISENKFNILKKKKFYNLLLIPSKYKEPEWEFPKGKKNYNEDNLTCAIREFIEETNITIDKINILKNINCIEEKYKGTNNKYYKHLYYMAISPNEFELNTIENIYEVGDIQWLTIKEALSKIRNYYINKINLIHEIYFFILNLILEIKK